MALTTDRGKALRTGIGIAALSALALSGCGLGGDAEFADDKKAGAEAKLNPTEADLLTVPAASDLGKIATTEALEVGDAGRIVVPSGELKVTGISTVDQVPASVIANGQTPEEAAPSTEDAAPPAEEEASAPASSDQAEENLRAADGMGLRLVTVAYTSNASSTDAGESAAEDDLESTADIASPELALNLGGQSRELPKLDTDGERTYLMSIPESGDAALTVTQAEHEQRVDLMTGQRVADDVAATYYREKTEPVVINEPLTFPDSTVKVATGSGNSYDRKVEVTTQLGSARLTPWTNEDGWAESGSTWMILDGEAGMNAEGSLSATTAKMTYTLDSGTGDDLTFEVSLESSYGTDDFREVIAVPLGTETIGLTGSAKLNLDDSSLEVQGDNPMTVKSEQPYDIDFGAAPDSSTGGTGEPTEGATGEPGTPGATESAGSGS